MFSSKSRKDSCGKQEIWADLSGFERRFFSFFNVFLFFNKNRSPIRSGMTLVDQVGDDWKIVGDDWKMVGDDCYLSISMTSRS